MKDQGVKIVAIVMVGLVVCCLITASCLKSLGRNFEKASKNIQFGMSNSQPRNQTLRIDLGKMNFSLHKQDKGDEHFLTVDAKSYERKQK